MLVRPLDAVGAVVASVQVASFCLRRAHTGTIRYTDAAAVVRDTARRQHATQRADLQSPIKVVSGVTGRYADTGPG